MKKTLIQGLFACGLLLGASAVQAQLAVVMGPNGAPISKDILANLYLGRSFEFKAIDLPEGSPMRDHFYKKLTDRDPAQVKAVWARVVCSAQRVLGSRHQLSGQLGASAEQLVDVLVVRGRACHFCILKRSGWPQFVNNDR